MSQAKLCILLLAVLLTTPALAEPVMLDGVPRTTWDHPFRPICILHTALTALGCPLSYEELMVASGSAFRMTWRPGNYSFPSSYLHQQDPISVGAVTVGATAGRRTFTNIQDAYDTAADSIDDGRPVIAWDGGSVDWQVICGYDEAKQTIFRRTINTAKDPEEKPAEALKSASLPYGGQGASELWLLAYDPTTAPRALDWPLILANAIQLSQWPDEEMLYGLFVCGDCAYYSWATDLRSSTLHNDYPFAGRVSRGHARTMAEARRVASKVLQSQAGLHPSILQAALLYREEADCFARIEAALCGEAGVNDAGAGKVAEQRIKDAAVREACADLVEQALAKNQSARTALTVALKDLAPDLVPVE